ncbi:ornithine carbamoyltransferase [Streptomyces poriferorum]|uniref:Ornithine carbamoyltransferase n=1 Tax=Streptomyces poriferorum TaxID=2798799 RepID=A0ABY9IK46_9ACTN|nr:MULTISPECIES: ornithine carbamoyltransferase [Streptomyces]MBW5254084.1 ornithine carbamoyltransferase [Streptomyces poriferorum]MBW5261918.1 ornithine carbamoyltransferase [Streptomyces poriferorum]MDP5315491.1 ornithine carbamoyltransferase [Streptomyces sp. Alt4]WLQ51600.1 ornithine carbamoyltransferase [Streptomyces sp. Alt1]WLQ55658.1 ornithine carbamoyltransferase [Streptomyces sp. Alt2]
MAIDLAGRHFLKELDFTAEEFRGLIALAAELKAAKKAGTEVQRLRGRNIALIFEKTSTRTRCAFEVAAADQGASTTYLDPSGSQIGHKESVKDTARVLGRMFDGIEYRGDSQEAVEELAAHGGVPVFNGLTDDWHPTQMLADVLTMTEHSEKPLERIAFAYLGDARFNMGNSYLVTGALLGMDVRIVAPKAYWPTDAVVAQARELAAASGATVTLTEDIAEGVLGADFVVTDVWVSMGEPKEVWDERITALAPYAVTMDVLRASGNDGVKFMHCLPAYHDLGTKVGQEIQARHGLTELEVSDEVFESAHSVVFDEAENRMHTIKAVLVATMATR